MDDEVVTYDQFPFVETRVQPLIDPSDSGAGHEHWRHVWQGGDGLAIWRIASNRWVQVLRSDGPSDLLDALRGVAPMETDDDGDWEVRRRVGGDGFSVTSGFAITYGLAEWQGEANDWLRLYGLELRNKIGYVQGEAHFDEIETGCFHDSLARLHWLESFCVRLNHQAERAARRCWSSVDVRCRPDTAHMLLEPNAILPPPKMSWR